MPASYNIELYQGDNYNLNFTIEGDYSSYVHTWTFATELEAASPTLNIPSGSITATYNAGTGLTTVSATITALQSAALDAETIYYYDYQVVSGGTSLTLLAGTASVYPQVAV